MTDRMQVRPSGSIVSPSGSDETLSTTVIVTAASPLPVAGRANNELKPASAMPDQVSRQAGIKLIPDDTMPAAGGGHTADKPRETLAPTTLSGEPGRR